MGTREVIFHVGLHKTGTQSIQVFLHQSREALRGRGLDFYDGMYKHGNHAELPTAALRFERDSAFKSLNRSRGIVVDEEYRRMITARVRDFISASACDRVLFSAEGLSILRYPDEMERLRAMVPEGRIRIVIYLRNPQDYLASYRLQLAKGAHNSHAMLEKDSYAYTGPDSWLLDFDDRVGRFRKAFDEISVLDYDAELAARANVIPSFLETIGIEPSFRESAWQAMFRNRTLSASRS